MEQGAGGVFVTDILLGIVILMQVIVVVLLVKRANGNTASSTLQTALEDVEKDLTLLLQSEIKRLREDQMNEGKLSREEQANNSNRLFLQLSQALTQNYTTQTAQQKALFETFSNQLRGLTEMNEQKLERVRGVVEDRLTKLQEDNTKKLEQMRQTVDEKLNATLEKRLSESFQQVSERLEAVHKGLGEMQSLANNVGDLKRVLTNVKTRGTFGEVQLEMLLQQLLSAEQYEKNVVTRIGSNERVEFAIKLPGREDNKATVYLPIDCKFPIEDYQRMIDAEETGETSAFRDAAKNLMNRIKSEAKTISAKYLDPPNTTDFAIMYLPIEGLFAEVLRHSGLMESIQQEYRVVIAGPTTLTALLNSLQMGFRTLAIQKRSSEVWELLGAIKTQFGTFGDLLQKTQKKLREASNSIDTAARKSRTIERKLRSVQELPSTQADALLPELAEPDNEVDVPDVPENV